MSDKKLTDANKAPSKIYLDIVEKLRLMIQADGLMPGDKIPSERELSERLQVGRSSVREALRSLELLGLIETRRGEGTFIKVFQEHRLVELLGAFFLLDENTKKNLRETKILLEQSCLKVIMDKMEPDEIQSIFDWADKNDWDDEEFFQRIFQLNPNHLLERIWMVVKSYEKSSAPKHETAPRQAYLDMLLALMKKDQQGASRIYSEKIRNLSKFI